MNLRELRALSGTCQDFEVWEVEGEEPIAYGKNYYMTREFDEREVLDVLAGMGVIVVCIELPPKEEPKPELNEYMVTIHRVCNVSVMAKDPEQAQRIGENLAGAYTSFACDTINAAMFECDDEFYGVGSPENVHIHLTLDENDSMRVLNEEE